MSGDTDSVEIHVLADRSAVTADSVRLSNETIRRSDLLQNIRECSVGSTYIPIERDKFKLWCEFEPGSSSGADLVKVMEVRSRQGYVDVQNAFGVSAHVKTMYTT